SSCPPGSAPAVGPGAAASGPFWCRSDATTAQAVRLRPLRHPHRHPAAALPTLPALLLARHPPAAQRLRPIPLQVAEPYQARPHPAPDNGSITRLRLLGLP